MSKEAISQKSNVGNLLGAARAEADTDMLQYAFVATHDFSALAETNDFNYVVGRRGAGKTALFTKLAEYFTLNKGLFLYEVTPEEHETLAFNACLSRSARNYREARAISRVIWKLQLLIEAGIGLKDHWKLKRSPSEKYLVEYCDRHGEILSARGIRRCTAILNRCFSITIDCNEIPGCIAETFELNRLQQAISSTLQALNKSAVFLFDNLDEGWTPTDISTAILGGLAVAVADLRDSQAEIYGILFVRDNIFRALAALDMDFSRHIEGNTLRLHWDEASLLHIVTERLRHRLSLQKVENDMKVWNRFAQRALNGRDGFKYCLQHTLYRPRDILVLLNQAFVLAARGERNMIIEDDIETAAKQISKDRLTDLKNEYAYVFPGLDFIIQAFKGRQAYSNYNEVVAYLDNIIEENPYTDQKASDLAVLGSGKALLHALYSVGFVGFEDTTNKTFVFCHDGAREDLSATLPNQRIAVHPCYWKSLDLELEEVNYAMLVDVHDDYNVPSIPDSRDIRLRMLGQLISELPQMATGHDYSSVFEEWVFRAVKILFAGKLHNPELKPNGEAIQRRDIVATNMADHGFWKRILDDYQTRQVIFEVKNYTDLKSEDFRQVLSYSGRDYGRFSIIVYRSPTDGLGMVEKGWLKEMYYHNNRLLFLMPASILARCIRKLRNPERHDYTERILSSRLDTFVRSYLALMHEGKNKSKKRKKAKIV